MYVIHDNMPCITYKSLDIKMYVNIALVKGDDFSIMDIMKKYSVAKYYYIYYTA